MGCSAFTRQSVFWIFKALYPDITLEYREYTDKKAVESVWYGGIRSRPDLFACGQRTVSNHPAQPQ